MPALHSRGQECVSKRHCGGRALDFMIDDRGFFPERFAAHLHTESQ